MKIKLIFFLMLILAISTATAQKLTDVNFTFKTFLFQNAKNITNSKQVEIRDLGFFEYFIKNTNVKLDTLSSNNFNKRFIFLNLDASKITIPNNTDIGILCENYKIVVDTYSGKSFRLGGFDLNDIMPFFRYLKDLHLDHTTNFRVFCKHYKVEKVDFECLYEAEKNGKYDPIKYPCSKRCSDIVSIN